MKYTGITAKYIEVIEIKIKSKWRYYAKHIGFVLLIVGIGLTLMQLLIPKVFPWSTIILGVSIVFQFIGWNEPLWFFHTG